MSKLRIKDAQLLPNVNGTEKIPTGGRGDYAVSVDQIKDYVRGGLPQQIEDHINDTENPHQVTKDQVGLGNADNTSDVDKPISTATQEALDLKANQSTTYTKTEVDGSLGLKADKIYVDSRDLLKADKTYVDSALAGFSNGASKFYPTLAAANADIANIAVKDKVEVGEVVNGGTWYKATAGATSLTKSAYDPLTQAKNYADANALFNPIRLRDTDLNTLTTVGIYCVTEAASATLALNFPKESLGFLVVAKSQLSNIVYQTYFADNAIYSRTFNGTSWSAWSDNGNGEIFKNTRNVAEFKNIIETAFEMSSNIFSGATLNTTIDSTGNIVPDATRWLGDFVSCEYGEKFSVSSGAYRVSYFDENKVFVSQISTTVTTSFTVSSGRAKYFRLSGTTPLNTMQLNKGETLLPYEPFKLQPKYLPELIVSPEQTTFFETSKNLFNLTTVLLHTTIDFEGNVVADGTRWLGDYIACKAGDVFSVPEASYRVAYFSSSKTFVNTVSTAAISSFTVPVGTAYAYFRLSSTAAIDDMRVNAGSTLLPYEPFGKVQIMPEYLPEYVKPENQLIAPEQTTFFEVSANIFDQSTAVANTSMDAAGNIVADAAGRWLSDFIPIEFGKTYSVPNQAYRINYFNGTKQFIAHRSTAAIDSFEVTLSDARYVRLSSTLPILTMQMNEGVTLLPYEPFGKSTIKEQYLPESSSVDIDALRQQLIDELTPILAPKYEPSFPTLNFSDVYASVDQPMWLSADGEVIYGSGKNTAGQLLQSTDDWATKVQIGTTEFTHAITGIRTLDDGELLISTTRSKNPITYSKVFKTVGYDRNNPSAATFVQVLESTNIDAFFTNRWGMSTYQNIVTISEYGEWGTADGAKHVYLSTDYGNTFNLIFDLYVTDVPNRPVLTERAHVHTTAYDPYFNRIWVAVGDNPNTATYYSDDMGASWTYVTDSNLMQYTGIIALPDAVLFGSDRHPNGVHVYHRKDKFSMPKIEPLLLVNNENTITHVFGLPFKKDWNPTTPVYFSAPTIQNTTLYAPCIVATVDGKKAFKMWEGNNGDVLEVAVGPTANNKVVLSLRDTVNGGLIIKRANAPTWSR